MLFVGAVHFAPRKQQFTPFDEEITSAYVNLLDEEDKEHQRILCELIRTLYKTVPLYSLKGHTRTELEEESQEARFHVIQGGKE